MDAARFDALARSLSTAGSRRRALAGTLAGVLGTLGVAGTEARKKKPCPPCKKRKHGKCKGTLLDGTACPGGTCQRGSCAAPPTCSVPCEANQVCVNGVCVLCGGTGQPCCSGTVLCGGVCVDTSADPLNCGSCGKRCQVNGVCRNGTCECLIPGCANSEASCCPTATSCACGGPPFYWVNPAICGGGGEVYVSSCPANTTPCVGPRCRACCPAGSTCDTSTGTCLQ